MFKYVVEVNGKTHIEYGINRNDDDFIKFLPAHFSRQIAEEVKPEHITIYKFDDSKKDLYEAKKKINEANEEVLEVGPSLKVCRVDKAKFKVGDKVKLEDYVKEKTEREEKFKDSKEKSNLKIKDPKSAKEEYNGEPNIDVVTIELGDPLTEDELSLEHEITGETISSWPYDNNGKFLGNN